MCLLVDPEKVSWSKASTSLLGFSKTDVCSRSTLTLLVCLLGCPTADTTWSSSGLALLVSRLVFAFLLVPAPFLLGCLVGGICWGSIDSLVVRLVCLLCSCL